MAKARTMAFVPEEDIFMAEQRKLNTSPLVKSLANMDQEIKAILEGTTMLPDRKIQLYNSVMNRYRTFVNQYRAKIPYVRVLPSPKRKKRKRVRRLAFATPIGSAVLPSATPVDVEGEEEEEPLLPHNFLHPLKPHPLNHPIKENKKGKGDFCPVQWWPVPNVNRREPDYAAQYFVVIG